jgi:hypothetical protein
VWRGLLLVLVLLQACQPRPAPGPTPPPEPPRVQELPNRGVQVDGSGTTQTDPITPPYIAIDVVSLSHDGHSTDVVAAVHDNKTRRR